MKKTCVLGLMVMSISLTSLGERNVMAAGDDFSAKAELRNTYSRIAELEDMYEREEFVDGEQTNDTDGAIDHKGTIEGESSIVYDGISEEEKPSEEERPSEENKPIEDDKPSEGDGETEDNKTEVVDPFKQDKKNWANAKISHSKLTRARTTLTKLSIKNTPLETTNYTISWTSSDKKIAIVDKSGNVEAKRKGFVFITCVIKTESGYTKRFICELTVSNPRFSEATYAVAQKKTLQLPILGTETTNFTITGNKDDLLKVYKKQPGLVKGKKVGTVTVTAKIDGITLKCRVIVSNPKIKKSLFVLKKDQKETIQIYNQSGLSKVKYRSDKPEVASVSSKGKITTKKIGVAVITATVDQKEFEITVSVGHAKAVSAIKYAQSVLGATYSQPHRMKKGYYDCSSLIWRAYRPTGLTFGYSKYASNAPTAAGEAYYLVSRGKEIASKYVDEKYLQPGDVIFISSGYNGRFRNITHVVMYIGNDRIIHATPAGNNCVQYGSYSKYKNTIVSIGRPVK